MTSGEKRGLAIEFSLPDRSGRDSPRVDHVYSESDGHRRLPWCWPDELVRRLRTYGIVTDLVTISYSVEGGYTPLKWKYLADELAARLRQAEGTVAGFEAMRSGILTMRSGAVADAERIFRDAQAWLPQHPAPALWLSELYGIEGRVSAARDAYRRAIDSDPSYRTPYRHAGMAYHREGRLVEAEHEYRGALALDPEDATLLFGLGRLAVTRGEWNEGESLLQRAIVRDDLLVDTHRLLGDVFQHQRRYHEAIDAYHRSILCALKGHRAFDAAIVTRVESTKADDPAQGSVYMQLGLAYAALGDTAEAIKSLRASIAGRHERIRVRWMLVRLYAMRGEWRASGSQLWPTLRQVFVELAGQVRRGRGCVRSIARRSLQWK